MKTSIRSPYISNKLFQTEKALSYDDDCLKQFNWMYSQARFELKDNRQISEVLEQLFDSISLENCEKEMVLFIEELKCYCKYILNNDLKIVLLNNKYKNRLSGDYDKKIYNGLIKDNCYILSISDLAVEQILKLSRGHLKVFEEKRQQFKNSREELSVNSGYVTRKICRILNREFKQQGVLQAMSKYIGFPVKVGGCSLELSVHEATWHNVSYYEGSNAKTKYFHHDESVTDPKAIIYLSEVSQENGPVSFLDESTIELDINGIQHILGKAILLVGRNPKSKLYEYYNFNGQRPFENEKLRKHFSKLPDPMKHNSHFGWDIVINSVEEKLLLQNEKKVIGSKGTCLLFDGSRLLHRGGIVKKDKRISLQIIFKHTKELALYQRAISKAKSFLNLN